MPRVVDLTAARERHVPSQHPGLYPEYSTGHICDYDGETWPCDAALFRDALDDESMERADAERQADAARALADELAEALDECHKRCEAFQPGGRGEMFPRAYDLDHKVGENNEGCNYCYALAKWEASQLTYVERMGGAGRCRASRRRGK